MRIFNAIIGVLAIFGALFCIFWPAVSFLNAGWIVALVLLLWGICAIVTFAMDRKRGLKDVDNAETGVLGLVFGIAACVVSVLSMIIPEVEALFLMIILILFIVFLFVAGIKNIVHAAKIKKSEEHKGWPGMLILGIIQLVGGLVGVSNWVFAAGIVGILVGVMLGLFGCTLIAAAFSHDKIDRLKDL